MMRRALGALGILLILLLVGGALGALVLAFSPALTPTPSERAVTHTPESTGTQTVQPVETPTQSSIQNHNPQSTIALTLTPTLSPRERGFIGYFPLEGDLGAAYPLSLDAGRFRLHYAPDTLAAEDPQALADLVTRGLENLARIYPDPLAGAFDIYVAGGLFAPPDQALRGRSFSNLRQTFILHDGTGNAADQQYIAAHEVTHLFLWNVYGLPGNALVSEGAAVDAGMRLAEPLGHLPLEQFCAAYLQAGALPPLSSMRFEGHIYDLPNYYAAGCFVRYLNQTYGAVTFGGIYSSLDFPSAYGGKGLAALEAEWRAALALVKLPPGLDPAQLVAEVEALRAGYRALFESFDPLDAADWQAYWALDERRIRVLSGQNLQQ